MASFTTRGRVSALIKFSPKIPETLKGGKLERIAKYFQAIAQDYKAAMAETKQDMQARPGKTAFYLSLLATGALFAKTNPSEASFRVAVSESAHDLLLLGDSIRNKNSDKQIQFLQEAFSNGTIRYVNCGFFSLVWIAGFDASVKSYEAQCRHIKPRWTEFYQNVVDVGILGRWCAIQQAMQDYDVNLDEWDEMGNRRGTVNKTHEEK